MRSVLSTFLVCGGGILAVDLGANSTPADVVAAILMAIGLLIQPLED